MDERASDAALIGTPVEHEAEIRARVLSMPECQLVDAATSVLAVVLERSTALDPPSDEPVRLARTAAVVAAVRAFRTIRAGVAMVASGYELEADAMTRVMVELFVSARAALDDPTGDEAKAWLSGGRRRGIGTRVDAAVPHEGGIYDALSQAAHGDARALRGLAVAEASGPVVEWGPRVTSRCARILIGFAVGARDFAVLLEEATGRRHAELTTLDRLLVAQVEGFAPDRDWSAPPGT